MDPQPIPQNPESPADNPARIVTPGATVAPTAGTPPPLSSDITPDRPLAVAGVPMGPSGTPPQVVLNTQSQRGFSKLLKGKKLLLPAIIALSVLGGSAGAYFGYYVPNKPENILAKSLQNTLNQHQFTNTGNLNITSGGVSGKVDYKVAVNEDAHTTDSKLTITVNGVNFPVEVITAEGNAYFKVGDLSSLEGVLSQFLGPDSSLKSTEDKIVKDVTNQWFTVDSTLLKEAKLDCLANFPDSFSADDINSLKKSYSKNQFATITGHSPDSVNGAAAIKYEITINDDALAKYDVNSSGYIKRLASCLNQGKPLNISSVKDGDTLPITVWVDKKTKNIVKYSSKSTAKDKTNGTTGDLSGTIDYSAVNITEPAGAKPVLSLLNDFDSFGLANAFGSAALSHSSGAADTERKVDINALTGQVEAYWADKDYYPTLANLNDPSWREANMKGLDSEALKDPDGTSAVLNPKPAAHVYAYTATPAGCDNVKTKCSGYTLTATLSDGTTYVKQSLNSGSNVQPSLQ